MSGKRDEPVIELAGGRGFEPRFTDPESAVLPLDDPPVAVGRCESSIYKVKTTRSQPYLEYFLKSAAIFSRKSSAAASRGVGRWMIHNRGITAASEIATGPSDPRDDGFDFVNNQGAAFRPPLLLSRYSPNSFRWAGNVRYVKYFLRSAAIFSGNSSVADSPRITSK
jgi:hypothetical protein